MVKQEEDLLNCKGTELLGEQGQQRALLLCEHTHRKGPRQGMHFFSHCLCKSTRKHIPYPLMCAPPCPPAQIPYLTGTSAIQELEFLIKILYLASRGPLDPNPISKLFS